MFRRLRVEIVKRPFLESILWYAGLAFIAVGLVLALDRGWLRAIACVLAGVILLRLGGYWALPWGRGALMRYHRRVQNAFRDSRAAVNAVRGVSRRKYFGQVTRLKNLRPPPGCEEEHDRYVALVAKLDEIVHDGSLTLAERDRRALAASQAALQVRTSLIARTLEIPDAYARSLEHLTDEGYARRDRAHREIQRAYESMARTIAALNPPDGVVIEHAALVSSVEAVCRANDAYQAAWRKLDQDAVMRSLDQWAAATGALERALATLEERLEQRGAWFVRSEAGLTTQQ